MLEGQFHLGGNPKPSLIEGRPQLEEFREGVHFNPDESKYLKGIKIINSGHQTYKSFCNHSGGTFKAMQI